MNDPWPKEKLDLHVTQRLQERVNIALEWNVDEDGLLISVLKENAEDRIWKVIQEAIEDAGWHMVKKNPLIEDDIRTLIERADIQT